MPVCTQCNKDFPRRILIDGKIRKLKNRKKCLQCSPFSQSNAKILNKDGKLKYKENGCIKCGCTNKRIYKTGLCNSCHVTLWRSNIKAECITYLGGSCIVCGYDKCHKALHFHHKDAFEKKFAISDKSFSFEKLKSELDKCVLVCSNCHAEIHDGLIIL